MRSVFISVCEMCYPAVFSIQFISRSRLILRKAQHQHLKTPKWTNKAHVCLMEEEVPVQSPQGA